MIFKKLKNNFLSKERFFTLCTKNCDNFLYNFKKKFELIFAKRQYLVVNISCWIKLNNNKFNTKLINKIKKILKQLSDIIIYKTNHYIFSFDKILQKSDVSMSNIITWQITTTSANSNCHCLVYSKEKVNWNKKRYERIFIYKLLKKLNNNKHVKHFSPFYVIYYLRKSYIKYLRPKCILIVIIKHSMVYDSSVDKIVINLFIKQFNRYINSEKNKLGSKILGIN